MSTAYTPRPPRRERRADPAGSTDHPDRAPGDEVEDAAGSTRSPRRGAPEGPVPQRVAARRRRRAALAAAAVLVLGAGAAAVPFTPAMPVKGIEVEGTSHLTPAEVEDATGIAEGTPMARVDMRRAAAGVAEMPWVKSATVKRHWPATIDVNVVENAAVAYLKGDGGSGAHLLDAEGREFAVDTPPPGAVELTGSALQDERVRAGAVAVATSISERSREQVRSIEASGSHSYRLKLSDDRTVIWGASEDNNNKALALETVLQREGREFNITNPELVTVK